jgi:hypothetical protein
LQALAIIKHVTAVSTVYCAPSKKLQASVFLQMVGFQTFSCWVIVDVSIPYSAIYTPARNDGFMFRLRRCHVGYHSNPKNNIACAAIF